MELTANTVQLVTANANVLFTETPIAGSCSIMHRDGSGIVTLRGLTSQCRARFRVSFGGNIAVPTTGTAGPIALAIAISGEGIGPTRMEVTPADENQFFNVYASTLIDVPAKCCCTISVKNVSTQTISVQNANLIVDRVA